MAGSSNQGFKAQQSLYPFFDGQNYEFWCVKMKTQLISNNLWEYVENGYDDLEEVDSLMDAQKQQLKAHKRKDARALSMIQQRISDTIFPRIINETKAKDAWDILQKEYRDNLKVRAIQHLPPIVVTMIPRLYKAAMEGQIEILDEFVKEFELQLTGNNNTVLHVAAEFGNLRCAEKILRECPTLLHTQNGKGETPLHIAVRARKLGIVRVLIKFAKEVESEGQTPHELLRVTDLDEDTALHMAARNGFLEIVRLLTREDGDYSHPTNKANETPLYLAVERRNYDMVVVILHNCASPAYNGPNGRTALHEAAMIRENPEIAAELLKWKPELIEIPDAHGWTPVHHAARLGNVEVVKMILGTNCLLAHVTTGENGDRKTALHIAAAVGNVQVMEEILSACPECWETVDSIGQNILHIAALMEMEAVIKYIFKKPWSNLLKNQKDNEGNTPFHLLAASDLKGTMTLKKYGEYRFTFNNKHKNPAEIALSQVAYNPNWPLVNGRNMVNNDKENLAKWVEGHAKRLEVKKKVEEEIAERKANYKKKMLHTHMIVAALIATITFAASFTIPGGYDPNPDSMQGMAILVREAAFKGFVITNTIAVICSTSSVFLYITASIQPDADKRANRHVIAYCLILIATVAMMLAFITGTYSMLWHSLELAIATCVLGCITFLIYFEEVSTSVFAGIAQMSS